MTDENGPSKVIRHGTGRQLSGGGSGIQYRKYEYHSGTTHLGTVIVASTDSPAYGSLTFREGWEYAYFDYDVSDYEDFEIRVVAQGTWPRRSPVDTQTTYKWSVQTAALEWVTSSDTGAYYLPDPAGGSDIPTGVSVTWPASEAEGRVIWFGEQEGDFFSSLDVDDSWSYALDENAEVSGNRAQNTLPPQ